MCKLLFQHFHFPSVTVTPKCIPDLNLTINKNSPCAWTWGHTSSEPDVFISPVPNFLSPIPQRHAGICSLPFLYFSWLVWTLLVLYPFSLWVPPFNTPFWISRISFLLELIWTLSGHFKSLGSIHICFSPSRTVVIGVEKVVEMYWERPLRIHSLWPRPGSCSGSAVLLFVFPFLLLQTFSPPLKASVSLLSPSLWADELVSYVVEYLEDRRTC